MLWNIDQLLGEWVIAFTRERYPVYEATLMSTVSGKTLVHTGSHGNPNVLTLDKGTSKLAQYYVAQTALVEVERFDGELPAISVFAPPSRPR
jgi:hypothetical protein